VTFKEQVVLEVLEILQAIYPILILNSQPLWRVMPVELAEQP
tara:strand:- start:413 stop:538 length:126 start_codon:yes stop_codon:yes gene_type:complete